MSIKFIILGSGSSMGVPRADGYSGNCNLKNKKNLRTRCSALIKFNNMNLLIDTSPDLRYQLLKNKIKNIDKVFYTHPHADQTHGINDLRAFYLINKRQIPVFADSKTSKYLKTTFKYCFESFGDYPSILNLNKLKRWYRSYSNGAVWSGRHDIRHRFWMDSRTNNIEFLLSQRC